MCLISAHTLDYLPEIFEKLFHSLRKSLTAGKTPDDKVSQSSQSLSQSQSVSQGKTPEDKLQQAIDRMKTSTKLEPFFEVVELLSQTEVSEEDARTLRKETVALEKPTTNELLAEIKNLISKQTTDRSAANTKFSKVKQMKAIIEKMLTVNEVPQEIANQAVRQLGDDILNELLTKAKLVYTNLKTIRIHRQKDLLITLDITSKESKNISGLILKALKEGKYRYRRTQTVSVSISSWPLSNVLT